MRSQIARGGTTILCRSSLCAALTVVAQAPMRAPFRTRVSMVTGDERRRGDAISPSLDKQTQVLVRYFYDGGRLSQGRLCELQPSEPAAISVSGMDVLRALALDKVDLSRFYACVYETEASDGGWLPVLRDLGVPAEGMLAVPDDVSFPLSPCAADGSPVARRIDVKLFRRDTMSMDAARAEQAQVPSGKIARGGYFGIGVVGAKNQANLGTLWRSAYQLDAAFLFTVGTRYRSQPTDTVHATTRVPLFEMNDWSDFATWAPRGAQWVAIEMGGTPLDEFEHPHDAIYVLGSEDAGLPRAVLDACHHTVSLTATNYASFNVAVAGSIVLYDRLAKSRTAQKRSGGKGSKWPRDAGG